MISTASIVRNVAVEETTTISGVGNYLLDGPTAGFFAFRDVYDDGDIVTYRVSDGPNVEIVTGVLTYGTPDSLSRDTIIVSSNSNNKVSWSGRTRPIIESVIECAHGENGNGGNGGGGESDLQIVGATTLETTVSLAVPSRSFSLTTTAIDAIIVVHIAIHSEGESISGQGTSPTVVRITDTASLEWNSRARASGRSTTNGYAGGPTYDCSEIWWAYSPGILSSDSITVTVLSGLGFMVVTCVAVSGSPDFTSPWSLDPSLPRKKIHLEGLSGTGVVPYADNISTTNSNDMVFFFYDEFVFVTLQNGPSGYILEARGQGVNVFISLILESAIFYKKESLPLNTATLTSGDPALASWIVIVDALRSV